jgi:thiosulfate/3-mercaptopyruvate sulfurtransferase
MTQDRLPSALISTDWLEDHLNDSTLRVLDATVHLKPKAEGGIEAVSGRGDFDREHVPGAAFADLIHDLSDRSTRMMFMLPAAERFAAAMEELGVGNDCKVVIYSSGHVMWATRLWWMLRAFGFENAGVLDGGFQKWKQENKAVSDVGASDRKAKFSAKFNSGLIANKDDVLAAVDGGIGGVCIMDALPGALYEGTAPMNYGRHGHIKSAINVPAMDLTDPDTGVFLSPDRLKEKLAPALDDRVRGVVTYCGGGIAATADAFALTLLGKRNVSVYDASMQEWARDESLPMEKGSVRS